MATVTVPESIVRAVAAAPTSHIRNVVLGALGLDPELEPNSEEDRQAAIMDLEQFSGAGDGNQEFEF